MSPLGSHKNQTSATSFQRVLIKENLTTQVGPFGEFRAVSIQLLHGVVLLLGVAEPNSSPTNLLLHPHTLILGAKL